MYLGKGWDVVGGETTVGLEGGRLEVKGREEKRRGMSVSHTEYSTCKGSQLERFTFSCVRA